MRVAKFYLTATLGDRKETVMLIGQADYQTSRLVKAMKMTENEGIQFDATMDAIKEVMNRGVKDELWAKGHITLTDEDGNLIHEMEGQS